MYLTLALVMLGVMSVSAGDRIPVDAEHFTFHNYDGWDANAQETGVADPINFLLGQADGCPIGDTSCNAWIDLGAYTKMYVNMVGCDENGEPNGSNPRIFINRLETEGQFNADKAAAKCLVIPNAGTWAEDFYTTEANGTIVIDLKKIAKEFGFVHFHSIKGSAWNTKAIVNSIEVEKAGSGQQIGWTNLINNSDMEGDDVSSFFTKIAQGNPEPSVISDGIGVNGSRGIMVAATAKVADAWDNQFWFRFNESVPAGTKYRVSFDYRADTDAAAATQAHAEPSDYIYYEMFGSINFEQNWKTFSMEGEVTESQAEAISQNSGELIHFQSVAFNLNDYEGANNYYFDNIKFEVYKYGTVVEYDMDVIQIDFGFDTNIADLVKAGGKPRLMFPEGTVTVKVNGEEIDIVSVEGYADGRFYIFHEEVLSDGDEVEVTFNNPADPAYHIIYTSGPGGDASNFTMIATNNSDIAVDDAYSYLYETPVILKAVPEDGSFNLPNNISEFKITFDKNVDCAALVAKLGNETLTVVPADGYAEEVTLTRAGGDLATGAYTLTLDKVYPEHRMADEICGTYTLKLSVGKVELDPNDTYEVVMTEDFAGEGDGWWVTADGGNGWQPANSGGGSRIMRGQSGFAPNILYLCTRDNSTNGTALYGNHDVKLTLKAKTYHLSFGAARWDGDGAARSLKVQVFPASAVDENGNADDSQALAEESKAIEVDFKTTSSATKFDVEFTAPSVGDYVLKFIVGNVAGQPAGYSDGVAIGDVKVEYVPNTPGAEETRQLDEALAKAKEAREAGNDDRYKGEAYNNLDAAIIKHENSRDGYTAPSQYTEAVAELTALTEAMNTHRANCDSYDLNLSKAIDLVAQYGETKFKVAPQYTQLKDIVAKYEGKVLTVDSELETAVAELTKIVDLVSYVFTDGESKCGDEGIKVLVERIRTGIETLKALGVSEDDELIVKANNTLTDDDAVADAIKDRIKEIVYTELAKTDNDLFKPVTDPETLEDTTPTYDMTIFVKNPNIYALDETKSWSEENVPGWVVPTGNVGASNMWRGTIHNIEGLPADYTFNQWHQNTRIEQTIGDLPAGVYTIVVAAGNWSNEDGTGAYAFVKTSDTPAAEEGEEEQFAASIPLEFWGDYASNHDCPIDDVVVTDGILTIGVNFGPNAQFEFDRVKVYLTAPAAGFDYATGIQTVGEESKVRAIQLFDLNGRRITSARQGVVIVKKIMDDGTIRTEKVVKK